ncbi:hypothetical protein ZYGR_0A03870 [Zygosaccharomyces rouxii]|uniref:Uncharacterized protein n=1 Tax=Zygosaccharomyces rouxii TaxID=4956 RepID=A0A1Q2ZTL1_ZYGRO|nr:hypothetical protein ZYGR_0A03870 [Zygosaccharomyces rouxii]
MTWPKRIPIISWTSKLKPPVPKVITFDAYNTLYSTTLPVMEQYGLVGKKYGIEADPQQLTQNFVTVFKELKSQHPNYGKTTRISANDWWCLLIQGVFQPLSPPREMVDEILTRFEGSGAYEVLPDVKSFLQKVKSQYPDVIMGIVSNTDPVMYTLLKNIGLYEYFQGHIYLSYDLEVKKPGKEIFERALEDIVNKNPELKRISNLASRCWHIGDEEVNDMLAASNVGWNGILLDRVNKYGYLSESFDKVQRTEHHLSIDKIDGNSEEVYRQSISQTDIVQASERTFIASNFESLKRMLL